MFRTPSLFALNALGNEHGFRQANRHVCLVGTIDPRLFQLETQGLGNVSANDNPKGNCRSMSV
jgi:hypothetical protein